jgi:pimeloyl-ACP methyl ester carboxylesterase
VAGGLGRSTPLPEIDPFNYITRVTMPILVLNGRDDFIFPLETSQKPYFLFLGTPNEHKRHALIDAGHVPPRMSIIKEILDWLDEYLGPVSPPGTS